MRRNIILILSLIISISLLSFDSIFVYADEQENNVIIFIDPGHGGDNDGALWGDYTEKEINMIVANAMRDYLNDFDGITVTFTREDDKDLSLEKRAQYAYDQGADMLYCLHFNMSEQHTLFGTECWVSAYGEQYAKGYSFALIEMDELTGLGLYSRGIKTRLKKDKSEDYYGILRSSTELGLTAVIIEHCHLDHLQDEEFYNDIDKLKTLGRCDGEAVAKFYGLKSKSGDLDFSNYERPFVAVPSTPMYPDETPPEINMIEVLNQNTDNGDVTVSVSSLDYDSGMNYYAYSYDGGASYSELLKWPDRTSDTFTFTMNVPSGVIPEIRVLTLNGYDLESESNIISLPSMNYETIEEEVVAEPETEIEIKGDAVVLEAPNVKHNIKDYIFDEKSNELSYFFKISAVCILLVLGMIISIVLIIKSSNRRKKRRKKRKR